MKRIRRGEIARLSVSAASDAWLILIIVAFIAALTLSSFFQGLNGDLLMATEMILVLVALGIVWRGYDAGFQIPRTALTLAITAYWVWLAITISWSRVAYYSVYMFWWMSTFPLAFWIYTLAQERDRWWRYACRATLVLGIGLALTGIVQLLVFNVVPKAMFINVNSYAALLNAIAVPAAAYFLVRQSSEENQRVLTSLLGIALFIVVYAVGITKGRAAFLSLGLGVGTVIAACHRQVSRQALVWLVAVVVGALVLANLSQAGGVATRLETLGAPAQAGWDRFLIWEGTWEMIKESPWWGIGLGIYSLAWPPYQHPNDSTAGFFAHNDYLQIWIEGGLPGLVLFVGILLAAAWMFRQGLRATRRDRDRRIELAGMFAAVLATAFHSLFDFNFYVVPILLLVGVYLARLQELASVSKKGARWSWRPARSMTRHGYCTVVTLLAAFPLIYFSTLSLSGYEVDRAVELAGRGDYLEAERALYRAQRFHPYGDSTLMSRADLYRHALTILPTTSRQERAALFQTTRDLLDEAETINPWRLQTFLIQAALYQENPDLVGADSEAETVAVYEHALRLNPRSFDARYAYAQYLISRHRRDTARMVLEAGLRYAHEAHPSLMPYYALVASMREEAGDKVGAAAMRARNEGLKHAAEIQSLNQAGKPR